MSIETFVASDTTLPSSIRYVKERARARAGSCELHRSRAQVYLTPLSRVYPNTRSSASWIARRMVRSTSPSSYNTLIFSYEAPWTRSLHVCPNHALTRSLTHCYNSYSSTRALVLQYYSCSSIRMEAIFSYNKTYASAFKRSASGCRVSTRSSTLTNTRSSECLLSRYHLPAMQRCYLTYAEAHRHLVRTRRPMTISSTTASNASP